LLFHHFQNVVLQVLIKDSIYVSQQP